MNEIVLKGIIRDIQYSHTIGNTEYDKANLIVKRSDGKEDVINLKFKRFSNRYKENDYVELLGNVRSYSTRNQEGKNHVEIYVFTYFDLPLDYPDETTNQFVIQGRVCKTNPLHITKSGKQNLQFILANNIISESENVKKINNYIPIVCWGKNAELASSLQVNDNVVVKGELHSRTYTKTFEDGSSEIRVATEGILSDILS